MKAFFNKIIKNWHFLFLLGFSVFVLAVSVRMTYSRYQNFENGKFDLGNMSQMVFNTMEGRFMYLTDYFGMNMPRWGMSHVDPFLIVFVPLMAIFKTPLVLVFSQLILVIFSSLVLFKIAELELKNKFAALFISLAYLFYPAIGYILAWTDFHGVTAVMPFFFLAFYLFERMYREVGFSKKGLFWFWLCLVLSMSGKEEIPLFVFMLGLFIFFFRPLARKLSAWVMGVSLIWFALAFFVIIPSAAKYRIEGYNRFIESIDIEVDDTRNVSQENYFLHRYERFGDTYFEVAINILLHPKQLLTAWLDGSKPGHFGMTFDPMLYMPLLYPPIFAISLPEFVINYTSTSGGVNTSNIENHRISLIIVVLFISSVYGIKFISDLVEDHLKIKHQHLVLIMSFALLVANYAKTFEYKNPIYLWVQQAIERRIVQRVQAEENIIKDKRAFNEDLETGENLKLVRLETKDRDCAGYIMDFIPDRASISGPDYMGAKLSLRETYALFPALYNQADFVIADIYSRKVSRVLNIPSIEINSVMGDVLMDPNYKTRFVCGNLIVFERGGPYEKSTQLPVQVVFDFAPTLDAEIFRGLYLRDFEIPESFTKEEFSTGRFVYERKTSNSLDDHKLFLTFVNKKTTEYYQIPHLPSYSMLPMRDWDRGRFYEESVDIMIPEFIEDGTYRVFLGLTDGIETRSVFLKDVEVK